MRINMKKLIQVNERSFNYNWIEDIKINRPEHIHDLLTNSMIALHEQAQENFGIIALSVKNKINAINILYRGTLDAVSVHPREIIGSAILANAHSFIIFHNHPSGNPTPSHDDKLATLKVMRAAELMQIELLDHIIIGDNNSYCSFKEIGLMAELENIIKKEQIK